jgi:mannosyltransferase OCH1-like enzyme
MVFETNKDSNSWVYADFDASMKTRLFPGVTSGHQHILGYDGTKFLAFCRELYKKYNPSVIGSSAQPIIPKIIHQIWLGSRFPSSFEPYAESWVARHSGRGWRYILWTDDAANYNRGDVVVRNYRELEAVLKTTVNGPIQYIVADVHDCELHNQEFYDSVFNFGMRSDILRWEVLCRYGGVYVDTDFECLKPFDALNHGYDFYTALQPLDTQYVQLGSAMFGTVPNHPILNYSIETIKEDWRHRGAPRKAGPIHFSKSFFASAGQNDRKDIAFPAHYFYPLGCRQSILRKRKWLKQGSFAVHHWSKSWMPKPHRPRRFRSIGNDESAKSWND